jgi:hypothetical protein
MLVQRESIRIFLEVLENLGSLGVIGGEIWHGKVREAHGLARGVGSQ